MKNLYLRAYNATLFKIVFRIKRFLVKSLSLSRPGSYPYITGDGFRSLSQHIFDDISNVDFNKVSDGENIFVRADMLKSFFEKVHPKINARYVLISHNADNNIREIDIDDKIIHWYSQNLLFNNQKVTPLPIGLINSRYSSDTALLKKAQLKPYDKKNKIVLSFATHMGRLEVKNKLIGLETTEDLPSTDKLNYYEKIAGYKFVASPEGNGIDCHRTWESMYLKSVPILIRNVTTSFFEKIGLPVLLINTWDEIAGMDESFLENKYKELESKLSSPALYMNYWFESIINKSYEK